MKESGWIKWYNMAIILWKSSQITLKNNMMFKRHNWSDKEISHK
jgi:hypothetical protein